MGTKQYICTPVHTFIHKFNAIHPCVPIRIHTRTHTHIHINTYIHAHKHTNTFKGKKTGTTDGKMITTNKVPMEVRYY